MKKIAKRSDEKKAPSARSIDPNEETRRAIEAARQGKLISVKSIDDLFVALNSNGDD